MIQTTTPTQKGYVLSDLTLHKKTLPPSPSPVHSVFDSASLALQYQGDTTAKTRELGEKVNAEKVKLSDKVKPYEDGNVFNPQYQIGSLMATHTFEAKLLKLNPNFRFRWFPQDEFSDKHLKRKQLYLYDNTFKDSNDPTVKGAMVKISPYYFPLMPEFSILGHTEQVVYEKGIHTVSKDQFGKDGKDLTAKTVYDPFMETVRGWRTVLRILYRSKIITKEQIIREFGDSDRSDWKFTMSDTTESNPWLQV